MKSKPVITTQPKSQTISVGSAVTFTVAATYAESYQWQYSKDGGSTWLNSTSTTASLSFTATMALSGRQYRCKVTNANGDTISGAATLTVTELPVITTQPTAKTVNANATVSFKVVASGATSYQWQVSKDNGSTWNNASGTDATFTFTAKASYSGWKYRCIVTNAKGSVTSNAVKLTVNSAPVITTQPTNKTGKNGNTVTFSVVATGNSLTYQWEVSTNGGTTWSNATGSGNTTATLTVAVTSTSNGNKSRCVVTNSMGSVTSNEATLTVSYG